MDGPVPSLIDAQPNAPLKDNQGDSSVPFFIPNKCPTKRKLDCTLTKIEEEVGPEAEGMQDSIVD
jgi:hypothetical protein